MSSGIRITTSNDSHGTIESNKTKFLTKAQIYGVTTRFLTLLNISIILGRIRTRVDEQEHIKYFTTRQAVWHHIKSKGEVLTSLVQHAALKYSEFYLYNAGKKGRYGKFLTLWYQYVGSWAIRDMCIDPVQQAIWLDLMTGLGPAISEAVSSHTLFNELFSVFSDLMDAAQSQLYASKVLSFSSVAAFCDPFNDSPYSDTSLYRIAGFALHSSMAQRRIASKSTTRISKSIFLRRKVKYEKQSCHTHSFT